MLIMTYLNETTRSPHNDHDRVQDTVNTGKEELFMRLIGEKGRCIPGSDIPVLLVLRSY
jgi:hypothetical protein